VFFDLLSEPEPVAAILIAHEPMPFLGGGAPDACRAEIQGRRPRVGEGFLGREQQAKGSGRSPDRKFILDLLRA